MAALLDDVDIASDDPNFGGNLRAEFSDGFPEEFEQDLPSGALGQQPTSQRVKASLKPTGDPVSAAMKRRLQAEIELWLELVNGLWGLRCEHCASHNEPHLSNLAKRATNIAARYPDLVDKLVTGGIIADSIALASAAAPIVRHGVGHHVTHTIRYPGEDEELGGGVDVGRYTQRVA